MIFLKLFLFGEVAEFFREIEVRVVVVEISYGDAGDVNESEERIIVIFTSVIFTSDSIIVAMKQVHGVVELIFLAPFIFDIKINSVRAEVPAG